MRYKAVFWDIDGTLYDNSSGIPDTEADVLSWEKMTKLPDRELDYWKPYLGLESLLKKIPQKYQGIISNNNHQLQLNKLFILGLSGYFNPDLIFTSYNEAQKVLDTKNHPLLEKFYEKFDYYSFSDNHRDDDIATMTQLTQKPETYMFELVLKATGFRVKDCVMIGDNWVDVSGAKKSGMKSIYIANVGLHEFFDPIASGKVKPDYTVNKGDIEALSGLLF